MNLLSVFSPKRKNLVPDSVILPKVSAEAGSSHHLPLPRYTESVPLTSPVHPSPSFCELPPSNSHWPPAEPGLVVFKAQQRTKEFL